jgi:hypothetical protein
MRIVVGIPSGQRAARLLEVCKAWRARGFDLCVLTWDEQTVEALPGILNVCEADNLILCPERHSFAVNQNAMMREIEDWDLWICGADDLFPGIRVEKLAQVAPRYNGKLLWCFDGMNPALMTHPVVTRGYWEKVGGRVFDERYTHNFCDTHLMLSAAADIVKLVGIQFDHRWHEGGLDEIYKIGNESFVADREKFIQEFGGNTCIPRVQEVLC